MRNFIERLRNRDDAGMTLVELLIASTLFIGLVTVVGVTMVMVNQVSANVNASFHEYGEVLPALAPLNTLIQAEVEPAPVTTANISPSPGFASVGNFALTFYSNIGTAGNNVVACPSLTTGCAATTAGPAMVVAEELDQGGNPVTSSTSCTVQAPCTFVVREYRPEVVNGVSTCPGVGIGPQCVYPTTYTQVVTVTDVVNNPSLVSGATGLPSQPIFTYSTFNTTSDVSSGLTVGNNQSIAPTTSALASQLDTIQSVSIDLRVAQPSTASNNTVENQLISYRYPESPGSGIYPFQYSTAVG